MNYKEIRQCRICGGSVSEPIFSLGNQSLTGVFPKKENMVDIRGPVDLVKCISSAGCGLVQLKQSYNIENMYGDNYGYRSGLNESMVKHLNGIVQKIMSLQILNSKDTIIDIGSNDCTTLLQYPKDKFSLIGIDPTGHKFKDFYPDDVRLIPDFFSKSILIKNNIDKAKVITSISMFYDLESPVDFAYDIYESLMDDGIWLFEQSYLPSMLKTNSFDTICHEHLEFYALKQIEFILDKVGFTLIDVVLNDVNGGSFQIIAAKNPKTLKVNKQNIDNIRLMEQKLNLGNLDNLCKI